jgi:hypothetical protein
MSWFCSHQWYEKNRHYEPSLIERGLKIPDQQIHSDVLTDISTGTTNIILCCEKCGVYKIYTERG